jgi:hypothetical protein
MDSVDARKNPDNGDEKCFQWGRIGQPQKISSISSVCYLRPSPVHLSDEYGGAICWVSGGVFPGTGSVWPVMKNCP